MTLELMVFIRRICSHCDEGRFWICTWNYVKVSGKSVWLNSSVRVEGGVGSRCPDEFLKRITNYNILKYLNIVGDTGIWLNLYTFACLLQCCPQEVPCSKQIHYIYQNWDQVLSVQYTLSKYQHKKTIQCLSVNIFSQTYFLKE